MQGNPAFLVGLAMAGGSFALFMILLATSGGVAKSAQFRVIGELFAGKHGATKRLLTIGSLLGVAAGACSLFGGIAARDRARADRCDAHCKSLGNARGVIGAASKPLSPPQPACRCEGGSAAPSEMGANDVPAR